MTEDEIRNKYYEYDEKYSNDEYDGWWEDYLNENKIKFEKMNFDVNI